MDRFYTWLSLLAAAMWTGVLVITIVTDFEPHKLTIVIAMFFTILYFFKEAKNGL